MSKIRTLFTLAAAGVFSFSSNAQLVGCHSYLIGHYVEVGVHCDHGHEGAPDIIGSHSRTTLPVGSEVYFGFVANPAEDGWGDYNGDFFSPGSPENGFGFDINGVEYSNNAMITNSGWSSGPEMEGTMTDYFETPDYVTCTWEGTAGDTLDVAVVYYLKKDMHFYTTTVFVENLLATSLDSVYYYRNVDPDNNVSIGWGYPTDNELISQSDGADEWAIVRGSQDVDWYNFIQLEAYGSDWRSFYGGFSNRDASAMWEEEAPFEGTEGESMSADIAIGLVREIGTMGPGKAGGVSFSFNTRFSGDTIPDNIPGDYSDDPDDTVGGDDDLEGGNDGEDTGHGTSYVTLDEEETNGLEVYPNPSNGFVTIQQDGVFHYIVNDQFGRALAYGTNQDKVELDLSAFAAGTYFVKVNSNGKYKVETLILK